MSATIELFKSIEFESKPLTIVEHNGRPAWLAREVGTAIGYANGGKRFANAITDTWASEFIQGTDHDIIPAKALESFKRPEQGPLSPRGALILYESGIHLALLKTRKPAGKRLRRFLAEHVLPQLVRTGRYTPDARPALANAEHTKLQVELEREKRLHVESRVEALRTMYTFGCIDVAEFTRTVADAVGVAPPAVDSMFYDGCCEMRVEQILHDVSRSYNHIRKADINRVLHRLGMTGPHNGIPGYSSRDEDGRWRFSLRALHFVKGYMWRAVRGMTA